MEEEFSPSIEPSKTEKLKQSKVNAKDAKILVNGHVLDCSTDADYDLLIGTLELDLTDNYQQAMMDITGSLACGYSLFLFPAGESEKYALEEQVETLRFNKET